MALDIPVYFICILGLLLCIPNINHSLLLDLVIINFEVLPVSHTNL